MTIVERDEKQQAREIDRDRLFQTHVDAVHAYVRRRVNLSAVAEDIVAEVFADVFRHPWRIPRKAEQAWLLGMARRKVADYYRSAKKRGEIPLTEDLLSHQPSSLGAVIQSERHQYLRRLMNSLPADQREALMLFYVEGLSPSDIAVTMRRSRFAVNSLLQRARKTLYERGRDYFEEEGPTC